MLDEAFLNAQVPRERRLHRSIWQTARFAFDTAENEPRKVRTIITFITDRAGRAGPEGAGAEHPVHPRAGWDRQRCGRGEVHGYFF